MTEAEEIDLLVELFRWDSTDEARFAALVILRRARRQEPPLWDDYKAGTKR